MIKNNESSYEIIDNNPLDLYLLNVSNNNKFNSLHLSYIDRNNFTFSEDFYNFLIFLEKECNFEIYSRVLKNKNSGVDEFEGINSTNFLINLVFEYVSANGHNSNRTDYEPVENEYPDILFGIFYPDVSDQDRASILEATSINKEYYINEYYGDFSYRNCSIIDLNAFYKILKILNKTKPDISFIENYNKKNEDVVINKFKKMLDHSSNEFKIEGFSRNGLIKRNKSF